MKALKFHASAARYLLAGALGKRAPVSLPRLRLEQIEAPEPRAGWRQITVRQSGICGSDLAVLYGNSSPQLTPFYSFPAVMGHEILAETDGVRVVVNPMLSCAQREIELCVACQHGYDHLCENFAAGSIAPGALLGYCRDVPGGWCEQTIAHEDRLHAIPDDVPDARAVLAEPAAVALHGVKLAFPNGSWPKRVLVIGAGTIGLLTVHLLRLTGFPGEVHVVARYKGQRDAASRLGATAVYATTELAQEASGAKRYKATIGPDAWRGGFEAVVEAAGSEKSLSEASWAVREGGTVLLLGSPTTVRHNFAAYWFREVSLKGSWIYTRRHFAETVDLLGEGSALDELVTHRFPLSAYHDALATIRRRKGIKVVFEPPS